MEPRPAGPARFLRTQHIIAAIIPVLIVTLSITGFVWAHKGVTVVVDGESRYMKTQADDVAGLLSEADIPVDAGDVVSPVGSARLEDGMTVVVRHAVPVRLSLSGDTIDLDVVGTTVADALVAAGVDPGAGLNVSPGLSTKLSPGMTITAEDVFVRIVQEQVAIPYDVVTKNDATLASGTRLVVSAGVAGTKLLVYQVLVTDGTEGPRQLQAEQIVTQPIDEVVAVGTKRTSRQVTRSTRPAAVAPAPGVGTQLTVQTTGYAPGADGVGTRTATGAKAGYGIIAVDPSVIPLGTRLYVPGYGYGVAADTGGAVKGNKIDLCFNTGADAIAWGGRTVTITILP